MGKIKFYISLGMVIIILSLVGIMIGMFMAQIEKTHPEYLSAGLLKGIIIFVVAFMITVCFHEMFHMIAYRLQGIGIRVLYIFPWLFVKETEGIKVSCTFNFQIGFGGVVIPEVPIIRNDSDYKTFCDKMRVSLICGPVVSALVGILSLLLACCTSKYIESEFCSLYFLFFFAMFLWAVYINGTSLFSMGSAIGDYAGAKKIREDETYSLLQIYNFIILQDNETKNQMRDGNQYIIDRMKENGKKILCSPFVGSMELLLMDAVLYESILRQRKGEMSISDIENLKIIICNNAERLQFESYFTFFSHAIMYLFLGGKTEEAVELWEEYKGRKSGTKVAEYRFKQVELFLYKKNLEELSVKKNIQISSLDSLLSGIKNYYDDELFLNNLVIQGGGDAY